MTRYMSTFRCVDKRNVAIADGKLLMLDIDVVTRAECVGHGAQAFKLIFDFEREP